MLACASAVGGMPAQVSEPHSPDAKDQVTVFALAGSTLTTGWRLPVTIVLITLVFQSMLTVTSL